jgi:integrase/recombinase XerD
VFRLIAVTGMRLCEAIGLQRDYIGFKEGVLTVRQAEFGKSRLLPLHATPRAEFSSYSERRDDHLGLRCGPYFYIVKRWSIAAAKTRK